MNGYSKMIVRRRSAAPPKSRSMDLTGLSFCPLQAQRDPDPPPSETHHSPIEEDQEEAGERFGVIPSRNCSSASQRFRETENEKINGSTLHAAVRRAFSMRKSKSVGDGYWRIHDTGDADEVIQEEEEEMPARIKKRGKFFRACKRLFSF